MNYEGFMRLLGRSKEYRIDGSVLTITDYHTGDGVRLNLAQIPEDLFEEMTYEEDGDEYW